MHGGRPNPRNIFKAVIQVIVNHQLFCRADGALHRVKLLGDVNARSTLLDHANHFVQMSICAFKALHNVRMGCMKMFFWHLLHPTRLRIVCNVIVQKYPMG